MGKKKNQDNVVWSRIRDLDVFDDACGDPCLEDVQFKRLGQEAASCMVKNGK